MIHPLTRLKLRRGYDIHGGCGDSWPTPGY